METNINKRKHKEKSWQTSLKNTNKVSIPPYSMCERECAWVSVCVCSRCYCTCTCIRKLPNVSVSIWPKHVVVMVRCVCIGGYTCMLYFDVCTLSTLCVWVSECLCKYVSAVVLVVVMVVPLWMCRKKSVLNTFENAHLNGLIKSRLKGQTWHAFDLFAIVRPIPISF